MGRKALILLGFLDENVEFTPLEERIGNQDMEKARYVLKFEINECQHKIKKQMYVANFYAQSSGTFSFDKLFVSSI